jgi:uncharacterized protein (DUF1697 family)
MKDNNRHSELFYHRKAYFYYEKVKIIMSEKHKYIALLRGINVGGHHKVPMVELSGELIKIGLTDIVTILNSGNIIFEAVQEKETILEEKIAAHLEKTFGFPIPVLLRTAGEIHNLAESKPFRNIRLTAKIRLYVSFLKQQASQNLTLPWTSEDGSFRIIDIQERSVCSVLDLSAANTPKGMETLEKFFGKDITTRNWNTVEKIANLI